MTRAFQKAYGSKILPVQAKSRGFVRIPIFVSMLAANVTLVTISVAVLVGVSVREFRADKETYVLDFASQVAEGTAQQLDGALSAERKKLELLATVLVDGGRDPAARRDLVESMFVHFPEVVRLEVTPPGAPPLKLYNKTLLRSVGAASGDAYEAKRTAVVPGADLVVRPQRISEDHVALTLAFVLMVPGQPAVPIQGDVISSTLTDPFVVPGAGETYLVDADGKLVLHPERPSGEDVRGLQIVSQALGNGMPGSLGFVDPAGRAWLGASAPVREGKLTVISQIPEDQAYAAGDKLVRKSLFVGAGLLVMMSLAAVLVARRFSAPLVRMAKATERIAQGDFKVSVPEQGGNEIGDLARSLNGMSAELLARDLRLAQAQEALISSEKMAAFGTLGAGIAHEVKNPLAGILGFSELGMRKCKPDDPVMKYLLMIEKETRRCTEIIGNLLKFARREKVEFQPVDLNQVVADTYKLVNHQLGLKAVHLELGLHPDLPLIHGNANQLQQVLLNLAINAGDAMPDGGKIHFVTEPRGKNEVEVRVTDNGTGMPPEVKAKIFDPFFTTKEPGKGTGLGLSVTFGIVKDHQGAVTVDSAVGKGTTFHLVFPRLSTAPAQRASA